MLHMGTVEFKAAGPARTWFPPYSILLTSTSPTTARKRWIFVLQFWTTIFERPQLGKGDPTVRPLTRSEWRDILSWADFEKGWPKGDTCKCAFSEDNYWAYGHEKFFGVDITKRARDAYRDGQRCPIRVQPLTCGHSAFDADFDDPKFLSFLAIKYAEAQLILDLALVDPLLSEEMEGVGRVPIIEFGCTTPQFCKTLGRMKRGEMA